MKSAAENRLLAAAGVNVVPLLEERGQGASVGGERRAGNAEP